MTFIATAWAISYVGAKPVFIDIDPARRTMDHMEIEAAITPRTKAVMPVHLFGMPAAMEPITAIARKHNIPIIEDAAQAHGARYQGKRIGQFGVAAGFSFYPGKNLGAYGEGGALVTNDAKLAARARSLREHGQSQRYYHEELGYNYRMDSLQGAVLSIKLRQLDEGNRARRSHAQRYSELLAGSKCVTPATFVDSESVWHCYVIEVNNRDQVRAKLSEAGIDSAIHYPVPVHLQKAYAHLGYKRGDLPVTERLCERCLSLPLYPELTDEQLCAVAEVVRASAA
jgi:dTDP-4-amino-4,6-dideoxygalactose transaminase